MLGMWRDAIKGGSAHVAQGYDDEQDFGSGHMAMDIQTIAGYYSKNPNIKVAVDQVPNAFLDPSIPVWQEAEDKIIVEIINGATGKKPVKQALDDAAKQVNTVLAGN
ncbi:MAG: hypothetical protein ACYDAG_17895 [Chloroflexota bacterium]